MISISFSKGDEGEIIIHGIAKNEFTDVVKSMDCINAIRSSVHSKTYYYSASFTIAGVTIRMYTQDYPNLTEKEIEDANDVVLELMKEAKDE